MIKHIAFIMDGNGRWAKARGKSRSIGHRAGEKAVKEVIEGCFEKGIKYVSLYAFSTENWKRSEAEINGIFDILKSFFDRFLPLCKKNNVKVTIMGDLSKLPDDARNCAINAMKVTEGFTDYYLNIGLNYGARAEIVRAINMVKKMQEEVSEEDFKDFLYTKGMPDLDLLIRTGGEFRLSNFMLYQAAYAELYFCEVLWPDFNKAELDKAIEWYDGRQRRFGGVVNV